MRPRRDNNVRADDLIALENTARENQRGLWGRRAYRLLNARSAAAQAVEANANCLSGGAPWRVIEARVASAHTGAMRAALTLEGAGEDKPFEIVIFGESFAAWDGPSLASLSGAEVRAHGPLGIYRGEPQMCLDDSSQLELLTAAR